jgi:hypothetical protein
MGASRPIIEREAWGRGHPAQPEGGMLQKFFAGASSRIRKFLIRKGVPEGASRPARGREATRPVSGRDVESHFFLLFSFGIYDLQSI